MITGVHALIHSRKADDVRAFFRDVLGLRSVDAGEGWLIFALPPAELAVHPADEGSHELYLMCDDDICIFVLWCRRPVLLYCLVFYYC